MINNVFISSSSEHQIYVSARFLPNQAKTRDSNSGGGGGGVRQGQAEE